MDRNDLIDEIAGSSAEDLASFWRDVLARRTEIFVKRCKAISTADLRTRGLELLERAGRAVYETRELAARQREHVEWVRKLGDETDDADVTFARDINKDTDRAANIVAANAAEMAAIIEVSRKNVQGNSRSDFQATVALANSGDCRLKVDKAELTQWQFLRMALEELFFPGSER
jgi:hypothetical protein